MTCILYKNVKFRPETREIIDKAVSIIQEYEEQNLTLTLRQIYYQFVSRGILPNTECNYKRLGSIINDARMAGLISWTAIEDRTRSLRALPHWGGPAEIIKAAAEQYRIDKWADQQKRVEVWGEKDALIGVIENICMRLDVPCFSCRGYVSASEMWVAAQRLIEWEGRGYDTVVLHLGDHDPSGIDMSRDIEDRLGAFGSAALVIRIALTMYQIERLRPPPNPAKTTDARFKEYKKRYGEKSWELDALDPTFLTNLIEAAILRIRDEDRWKEAVEREKREKIDLLDIVRKLTTK